VQGAVSVELVHMGSLYHDDVIDEAGRAGESRAPMLVGETSLRSWPETSYWHGPLRSLLGSAPRS